MVDAATEAAEAHGDRLEVLAGDIGERRLGLAEGDHERLRSEVGHASTWPRSTTSPCRSRSLSS